MPLTLRITSAEKDILGPDSTRVFGVHGGSIGRAPDNEWPLPDPRHYLSAHHAIIDYQGGGYYLTDTSTNGVFVNDSDQPVGKGTPLRLYDGDRIAMGDYRFDVNIVNVSGKGAGDTGVFVSSDDAEDDPSDKDEATEDLEQPEDLGLNLEMLD
ncbi:MAG: type VI secretion system-associated FHA domain protein, partial [Gammaproteobacteria bacterium]